MNKVRNLIQLQIIAVISVLKQLYLTSPRESPTKRLGRQPIPEIHANNRDKRQNGFRSGPINALVALRRLRNDRFIADHCTRAYARIKKNRGDCQPDLLREISMGFFSVADSTTAMSAFELKGLAAWLLEFSEGAFSTGVMAM